MVRILVKSNPESHSNMCICNKNGDTLPYGRLAVAPSFAIIKYVVVLSKVITGVDHSLSTIKADFFEAQSNGDI